MKVYFIENENPYKTSSGGIMSYLMNLSKFLKTQNVDTILCGVGEKKDDKNGIFSRFIQITPKNNPSNFKYLSSLFLKLKSLKIDSSAIIHAQRPDMLIPSIIFYRKNRLVCSLHGTHDLAVYDKKGFIYGVIYQLLQSIAFRFADLLIAVDEKTKIHFIEKYPHIKDKIKLIPIAVDTEKFYPIEKKKVRKKYNFNEKDKIIIFVGRLEKEKNVKLIIDSFAKIQAKIENLKLLLVGTGRQEEHLKRYVSENKIENVIFKGEVANEIIPELLNCADIFAFSSLYEGSPTVIKEALACNIPIVSVDVGDVKSVITNLDGCALAKREIEDFSSKIARVLENKNTFEGRKRALQFNSASVGQMTLDLYADLLRQNNE